MTQVGNQWVLTLGRTATAEVRAELIFAAYEVLEEHGEKATAQIIRLVKAA